MNLRIPHIVSIALTVSLILSVASCEKVNRIEYTPNTAHADSLMEAAHLAHDSARILALADSLEAVGDFSPIKADYWRGYSYYSAWNHQMSLEYWYRAISLEVKDREDLVFSCRAANRLSDVLLGNGEAEASMRVALPAIEAMREGGISQCRDYAYLLLTVGCCELNNGNKEIAEGYFQESYQLMRLLLEDNGINGNATHEDNLKSAVAGYTTIARHYLEERLYPEAILWVDRLDEVMEDYSRQPETTAESLDRRIALGWIYRATALEGLGEHQEAAAAYDKALTYRFCTSAQGRIESARYLMLAERWTEAADNYKQLEGVASIFGAGLTLDNIQLYLLPKLRANYNSNRMEDALSTGIYLCDALDSAIVWNRDDKAAELTTIYHTQEIRQEYVQQKADLNRLRYISSVAVIVLLLISFLIFVIIRHRSSMRLEKAYQELEVANARAEESSRVKTAFIQQISHEIRTPLNLLSGFSQVLTSPDIELDEESRKQINEGVLTNTGRITGLVSKILDLSDLISRTELEKKDHITPIQIAQDAADKCGILKATGIKYFVQAADSIGNQELITDGHAAMRILSLLLENAVKYTGQGVVTLRIVPRQNFVCFLVEDTGIGVPPEQAEHIFERFVQLDDYREGTGIGLSLARSLARRLGGDVVLDTSYGPGARFIFSLPSAGEE